MKARFVQGLVLAGCVFWAGGARAHDLACAGDVSLLGSTAQAGPLLVVQQYPASVQFRYRVTNLVSTDTSVMKKVSNPLLSQLGIGLTRWTLPGTSTLYPVPLNIPMGATANGGSDRNLALASYEACKALALFVTPFGEAVLDTRLIVEWEAGGQAQCTSRVVCLPPDGAR